MRKTTTVGAAAVAAALVASLTLASGGPATATTAADSTTAQHTAPTNGLTQTTLPVLLDPAASLAYDPGQANQSWYVTAHVTAGGHRYGFLAHFLNSSRAWTSTPTTSPGPATPRR